MVVLPHPVCAATPEDRPELFVQTHARVDWHQIVTPFQKILLIKKGEKYGAVRFTEFNREDNATPGSAFREGKATEYAKYEWYYQGDGSGDFTKSNVKHGKGELVDKPLRGIGRLAFQTGTVRIEFGDFNLFWLYPTSVSFYSRPSCSDTSVELAPTKSTRIEEISIFDPKIKWYQCDESRKNFLIPVEELR
jgi:hypothetical protein